MHRVSRRVAPLAAAALVASAALTGCGGSSSGGGSSNNSAMTLTILYRNVSQGSTKTAQVLEQERVIALEARIGADLDRGAHEEVVAELFQLILEFPACERMHAHLMTALYRSDRQADALQAYGRARDRLAEELGIDPGQALRQLELAILQQDPALVDKNYFVYHSDPKLSSFAVSLLNFPYDESEHWRTEFNPSSGYQKGLFAQSYEDFISTVHKDNKNLLMKFLKIDEDRTGEEVDSAINYLKLRKIKRMLLENQLDMEKAHTDEEYSVLAQTHLHLKQMEMELARKIEAVVMK